MTFIANKLIIGIVFFDILVIEEKISVRCDIKLIGKPHNRCKIYISSALSFSIFFFAYQFIAIADYFFVMFVGMIRKIWENGLIFCKNPVSCKNAVSEKHVKCGIKFIKPPFTQKIRILRRHFLFTGFILFNKYFYCFNCTFDGICVIVRNGI